MGDSKETKMATNLAIDDKLIEQALKLGHHKSKKEAVTTALNEYIQHKQQQEMFPRVFPQTIFLFGLVANNL